MVSRAKDQPGGQERLPDIARQEFVLVATAFFAPVVGTWRVMRSLLSHRHPTTRSERGKDSEQGK